MNKTLKQLFDQDQSDRENLSPTPEELNQEFKRDGLRRGKAQKMIDEGLLINPEDYYHAAFIFQHGITADDFLKANGLAKKALEMGYEKARWIFAATRDRYLIAIGKPQRYGTQYIKKDGKMLLAPIDPETTDEERVQYGVKPLNQISREWSAK